MSLPAGIHHDVAADVYHSDPAPEPSLSSSIACEMLDRSPRHAWAAHPRLNPEFDPGDRSPSRLMEIGTAAHNGILGAGAQTVIIDAADYKTKAAQAARADALASGMAPILAPDYDTAAAMILATREQIEGLSLGPLFAPDAGHSEVVLIWRDQAGPWCRAMMDRLVIADGRAVIIDIKTSGTAVAPAGLGWKIADMGYETKAAFYERGLAHLRPDLAGRIRFLHLWIEQQAPHGVVVSELDGAARSIGARKAAAAIGIWHRCLSAGTARGNWPGYPVGIQRIEYPGRAETQWLEREDRDDAVRAALTADPFLNIVPAEPEGAAPNYLLGG